MIEMRCLENCCNFNDLAPLARNSGLAYIPRVVDVNAVAASAEPLSVQLETSSKESSDRFGDILLKRGQVRRYQLDFALALQKAYRDIQKDIPIGEILVQHRAISDKTREDTVTMQNEQPLEPVTKIMKGVDLNDTSFVTKIIASA